MNNQYINPLRATLVVAHPVVAPKGQPQGIAPTLGEMVGAFKSITTIKYIRGVKTQNWSQFDKKLWQRNYWEHIIQNNDEYHRSAQYILDNPKKWVLDKLNGGAGNQVMEFSETHNEEAWMLWYLD